MTRKGKISPEEKVKTVELYLQRKVSFTSSFKNVGITKAVFKDWIMRYEAEGPTGFLPKKQPRQYTNETKQNAIFDYLSGKTATGGIGTAITNMQTAMVRGTTAIIAALDEGLSSSRLRTSHI